MIRSKPLIENAGIDVDKQDRQFLRMLVKITALHVGELKLCTDTENPIVLIIPAIWFAEVKYVAQLCGRKPNTLPVAAPALVIGNALVQRRWACL